MTKFDSQTPVAERENQLTQIVSDLHTPTLMHRHTEANTDTHIKLMFSPNSSQLEPLAYEVHGDWGFIPTQPKTPYSDTASSIQPSRKGTTFAQGSWPHLTSGLQDLKQGNLGCSHPGKHHSDLLVAFSVWERYCYSHLHWQFWTWNQRKTLRSGEKQTGRAILLGAYVLRHIRLSAPYPQKFWWRCPMKSMSWELICLKKN